MLASACKRDRDVARELLWRAAESLLQIVGDERLSAGECVLETNVGTVELGVSAQLEEIERDSSICCTRGRRDDVRRKMRYSHARRVLLPI